MDLLEQAFACTTCAQHDRVYMQVHDDDDIIDDEDFDNPDLVSMGVCCSDAAPARIQVKRYNALAYQTRMLRLEEEAPSKPSPGSKDIPDNKTVSLSGGTPSPRRITKADRVLMSDVFLRLHCRHAAELGSM